VSEDRRGWTFSPPTPWDVLKWAAVIFAVLMMGLIWVYLFVLAWNAS
jgi:hypothetical protein